MWRSGRTVRFTGPAMAETPDLTDRLAAVRAELAQAGLHRSDLLDDPVKQLQVWWDHAVRVGVPEPEAMALATADIAARPSVRFVLLRGLDERGLVFFTNYESHKARQLAANPQASLVFPWYALRRQVVVAGAVTRVDRAESEAYFAGRPRESQLGAWASRQSRVVPDRATLDDAWRDVAERFPADQPVPAPPFWGGYRLAPDTVEFWQGRTGRMHDRLRYRLDGVDWLVERLAP